MEQPEFEKLTKLLQLSTSEHDGEALSAMRAANAILAKYDVTWEQFFRAFQETVQQQVMVQQQVVVQQWAGGMGVTAGIYSFTPAAC